MRPMILSLCLVGGLAGTVAATAAPAAKCDRNDQSQIGLDICADADFKAADAKLNKTYGTVMKRLAGDADTKKLLQVSQRAWIAFRDAECDFRTNLNKEGTIHPMVVAECRQELTEARTRQLDAYLHCQEGDLACPVPAP